MPLIEITTTSDYFPYQRPSDQGGGRDLILKLAMSLPGLMASNLPQLRLDPATEPEAVQVTLHKFHSRSVNNPDVWIKVQFSESDLTTKQQLRVAKKFKKILANWFRDQGYQMPDRFAIDLLWGPTHGFYTMDG